jgi:SWI/SNF-related matrix-associated actin-dependent regulator of chromatin subfamily A-like protein 1
MFKLLPETELKPHQKRYVEVQLNKKALGNFDKPGTGKTLEILASICEVGKKALIICPPHLANNWTGEIEKFTQLELHKDIQICPYTMVEKRIKSFEEYGFIALDEAHYIKNLNAKRTQAIHTLLYDHTPEFYAYATGTPIMNRIPEIYSFLVSLAYHKHVTPNILAKYPTHYQFCQRFCNVSEARFGGRSVMQYSGMKNVDELKEYIKPWTISRNYSETEGMDTQMIRANYKEDSELDKAWQDYVQGSEMSPTAKRGSALAKAHFTAEYVKTEIESNNSPLVVFSDHPDVVHTIEREVSESARVASIVGGMPMSKRTEVVEKFQRGQLDVIVLTTGSSSTGITLTKASTVIFNDVPWQPEELHQARKRIDRIGQTQKTRAVYIVGSKVDERIIKTLTSKMKVINKIGEHYGE